MDVFQLATRLVTTGEEQTAAALKRVEGIGTSAANNITTAWSGVTFDPATRSAGAFADASGNLAAQIRLATSAATQQVASVESLGGALRAIDATQLQAVSQEMVVLQQRIAALQAVNLPGGKVSGFASVAVAELGVLQTQLLQTRAGFVQMGGSLGPAGQAIEAVGGKSTTLATIFAKLQKALFITGTSAIGLPGKFGAIGAALLRLGGGGAVVAAVTVGMALIGLAMQKAREKAQKESDRITQTIQTWQDRLDELTGAARRREIEALAGDVERLAAALAKAQSALAGQRASSLVGAQSGTVAEVARLQAELKKAQDALELRRGTEDTTGPVAAAKQKAEDQQKADDEARTAYERRLSALTRGAEIEQTREASLVALQQEEAKLTAQLERGNLPLEERVRIAGMLLQVQTALGSLPETEEQRAAATARLQASYEDYLGTLQEAVAFEATRPAALAALDAEIGRLTTRLAGQNLELAEEVRLRRILAGLQGAQTEGRAADREQVLKAKITVDLAALNTGLAADLAVIEENTNAMLEGLGQRLSKTAQEALQTVNEALTAGMRDAVGGLFEGLARGLVDNNAKAGDLILASLGSIFTQMGKVMIASGIALAKFMAALTSLNPFAAIAAGVLMLGIGTALSAAASGRGGGSGGGGGGGPSFNGYQGNQDRVVRIIVGQPSGTSTAPALTPAAPINFTIIGPADPVAQRGIAEMVNAAQSRGLLAPRR